VLFWFHRIAVHSYMFAPRRLPVRRAHTGRERGDWPHVVHPRACARTSRMQRARWPLPWPRATTLRPSLGQPSSPLSPGLILCVRRFLTETEQSRRCRSLPRFRRVGRLHTTSVGRHSPLPPLIPPLVPNPPTLQFLRPPDHLPCRPSHGDKSRGGYGCRAPPSTAVGTSSDPSNHRNRTLGEQGSLPHPFPAKNSLPLAGFRRSPSLAATRGYIARSEIFPGARTQTQWPVCKNPVFRSRVSRLNLWKIIKIVEKSEKYKSNFVGFLVNKYTFSRKVV
jgi:hypothetical protein